MVKIYTTPACPYCYTVKQFFKKYNVEFEEIDLSADEKLKDEIIEKTGQMGVPVLEINNELIVGFDRAKIINLLGIKE